MFMSFAGVHHGDQVEGTGNGYLCIDWYGFHEGDTRVRTIARSAFHLHTAEYKAFFMLFFCIMRFCVVMIVIFTLRLFRGIFLFVVVFFASGVLVLGFFSVFMIFFSGVDL